MASLEIGYWGSIDYYPLKLNNRNACQRPNWLDIDSYRSVGGQSLSAPTIAARQAELDVP